MSFVWKNVFLVTSPSGYWITEQDPFMLCSSRSAGCWLKSAQHNVQCLTHTQPDVPLWTVSACRYVIVLLGVRTVSHCWVPQPALGCPVTVYHVVFCLYQHNTQTPLLMVRENYSSKKKGETAFMFDEEIYCILEASYR